MSQLSQAFQVYWEEMRRCRKSIAYWSLLHLTLCLPDICAALQSPSGKTDGTKYRNWCKRWFPSGKLSADERREMRNKILHQGRSTGASIRYIRFAFYSPPDSGHIQHLHDQAGVLYVNVDELAKETKSAVERWIADLDSNPTKTKAVNAFSNLSSLVKVVDVPTTNTRPGKHFGFGSKITTTS
jgi:hypothetical protein